MRQVEKHRYFIELEPDGGLPATRETRRAQALRFITTLRDWLAHGQLRGTVGALDVTLFGQVHIVCDAEALHHIRHHDDIPIAAIRPAAKWAGAETRIR